mgnify:CR=1 FL=1
MSRYFQISTTVSINCRNCQKIICDEHFVHPQYYPGLFDRGFACDVFTLKQRRMHHNLPLQHFAAQISPNLAFPFSQLLVKKTLKSAMGNCVTACAITVTEYGNCCV